MKLAVFAATIAFAVLAVACGEAEGVDPAGSPTVHVTPTGQITPQPPIATICTVGDACNQPTATEVLFQGFTPEEVQKAKDIVTNDPSFIQILNGAPYEIANGGRTEIHDEVFADITVALDGPLSIDADLPTADMGYRGGESNPGTQIEFPAPYYIEGTSRTTIDALSMAITVDLTRGKVITILPLPFPATEPTPP